MPLHLLLAEPDAGPLLAEGLGEDALDCAAIPSGLSRPSHLFDEDHLSDLAAQRWAVLAPLGPEGERRLDAIAPLVALRKAQQGAEPLVFRVGPDDPPERLYATLYDGSIPYAQCPRYLLILGDLHEISVAMQRTLASTASLGRLCFPTLDGYRAYAEKVVRWEGLRRPLSKTRALFYSVQDPSDPALKSGYGELIEPLLRAARDPLYPTYASSEVDDLGLPGVPVEQSFSALLQSATADNPSVLFSLSHGLGSARWSAEEQRARQGALKLGRNLALDASDMKDRSFLPGGIWFLFACFSAGTPATSLYQPWLDELVASGAFGAVGDVRATLARERPFVAALPQAVLANPNGPLAVVGHVDLAWGWSYRDEGESHASRSIRFEAALRCIGRGDRVGVGVSALQTARRLAAETMIRFAEETLPTRELSLPERRARGHAWMTWHDLGSWILLGDPAVQLPLGEAPAPTWDALIGLGPSPAAPAAAPSPGPPLDTMVELVLGSLAGAPNALALAEAAGVSWGSVKRWEQAFLAAGRAALAGLRAGG